MTVVALLVPTLVALLPATAIGPAAGWTWPLPTPHHVVRGFDPPIQPWLAGHRGVDLIGTRNEPVLAAGAGIIAYAGMVADIPVVSIAHPDGLRTTYEPVATQRRVGTSVSAGEQIGRLEPGGSHCAPDACLHWGLKHGPDYLDPLALLHLNPVRLLPLDGPPVAPVARAPVVDSATGAVVVVTGGLISSRRNRRRQMRRRRRAPS